MSGSTTKEIFVDGTGRARYSGGVVRVDFVSATDVLDDPERKGESVTTHRVIMAPDGFIRTVGALNNLMQELMKAGVITQRTDEEESAS